MPYIDWLVPGLPGPITMAKGTFLITLHKLGPSLVVGGRLKPSPNYMATTQQGRGEITVGKTITDQLLNKLFSKY